MVATMSLRKMAGMQTQLNKIKCMLSIATRSLSDIRYNDLEVHKTSAPRPRPSESTQLVFGKHMADHMLIAEWTSKNGWDVPNIVPFGPLAIAPSASVLHYGIEVFEGMKAYRCEDGSVQMFRPEENMMRLFNSANRLSLPTFDKDELLKCISELVRLDQDWIPDSDSSSLYIRPTIISTEASLGVKPPDSAMLFVITGPVGPYFATGSFNPISLLADPSFVRAWPGGVGDCKAGGNYGPTIYAQKLAQSKGCAQCLWLYKDQITEVGTMNFFMYWINEQGEEELITPPLNGLILPGITRKSLLELGREWNEFKVSEEEFTIQQVDKAAQEGRILEIFGAGTAAVVSPVNRILYQDDVINIENARTTGFPLAQRFHDELTSIQYGRTPHRWNHLVDSPELGQSRPNTLQ